MTAESGGTCPADLAAGSAVCPFLHLRDAIPIPILHQTDEPSLDFNFEFSSWSSSSWVLRWDMRRADGPTMVPPAAAVDGCGFGSSVNDCMRGPPSARAHWMISRRSPCRPHSESMAASICGS
jgi:hypothetical protein